MPALTAFYAELQKLLIRHSESLSGQTASSAVLGEDREYFVRTVLDRSLPLNITTSRGVIVDSRGGESNPQDVILYRSDFPIMASFVGSRRVLAEGVVACIEVKSDLDKKEFGRALSTLKTTSRLRQYDIDVPPNLSQKEKDIFVEAARGAGYTKNQISSRRYVFAYRGVTWNTLKSYIIGALGSDLSFWQLPSAVCVLNRGICLIRDDGQVLPPYPAKGASQCIYCLMKDRSRALEFFMLHILSSCDLAGPGLRIYGTPLRFSFYHYMDQPVAVAPLYADIQPDLSPLKISWEGRQHLTTNDVLSRQAMKESDSHPPAQNSRD
jgi:hypothetical protein